MTLLAPFYEAEGVAPAPPPPLRRPFDAAMAEAVEAVRPEIVSFHFGLPDADLLARVRASGALVFGNATTPDEMRWLADAGVDAIVLQGEEAGGHAGWFLDRHRPTPLAELLQRRRRGAQNCCRRDRRCCRHRRSIFRRRERGADRHRLSRHAPKARRARRTAR